MNEKRLREEIKHLRRSLEVRAQLDEAAQRGQEAAGGAAAELGRLGESGTEPGTEESVLAHLRLWATFTCAHYGLEVDNLTVSFCDGRALCLLLHHYYPDLLPRDLIQWDTTQNIPAQEVDPDVSADDSFYEMTYSDTSNRQVYAERLANDKANFTLFIDKVCVCVCVCVFAYVFVNLSMQVITAY
ncbi:Abnormal spindle-like microcephaly-associated [Portunus trituberculatus]|uniref:Abnormal spindle-like microcephaly-associated n=1 Tax=Portunus trituberculatus TaxID=210409 RepID=A0A5B7CWJ8_PORTR|nr:Abnormal spindle-like microcephaly-associated [Portunus trituberculatus]